MGPKSCGLSHERRDWKIFPSPSVPCRNSGGGGSRELLHEAEMLKVRKKHATKNCHIKERLTNQFCINCQDFGHSACYTKCPKFPQPKKGTAFTDPIKKKNFASKWTKEGISFANVVSGEIPSQTPPENNNNKKEDSPREFLSQEDNISDLAQVLELFNIISKLVKKNPKILDLLYKFKNSNSDEEKACLLAEAIMNNV
ncbi:uncharacterized protein TNCV_3972851 [Trichonephila clavipes]|nr:uncharacterized protein TNCV_3972851 [Trichonephila clavipes]